MIFTGMLPHININPFTDNETMIFTGMLSNINPFTDSSWKTGITRNFVMTMPGILGLNSLNFPADYRIKSHLEGDFM